MPKPTDKPTTRLIVLGSTGSIGRNTLEVIRHLNALESFPRRFEIVGLAAATNEELLAEQAGEFEVEHTAIASPAGDSASSPQPDPAFRGADAACELVHAVEADFVVAAIVGFAGLPAVVAAIECGCHIALANKETLVAAGEIVMALARDHGVKILPVDSEHSAIFQCLQSRTDHHVPANEAVQRIVLTASGGPFRTWTREQIANASVEEALDHPTWSMGGKVTIDSASLTNKGLEMIEAHHLFAFDNDRIEVLVHPQSVVHGFVEFVDGSVIAQLGTPDMRTPIQYALTYPERPAGCNRRLDWLEMSRLEFEPPDVNRFPSLNLARRVIEEGGTTGAVFNAANETAVHAFLHRDIPFNRITELAHLALEGVPRRSVSSMDDVVQADAEAREFTRAQIQS